MTLTSTNNMDAIISFQANQYMIEENQNNEDLVTCESLVEKLFLNAKTISDKYGCPIYFGEFCVITQYISDYTNFTKYTDKFSELANKYSASWSWHCMSENSQYTINDNGYGAYVGTYVPYPEYKNINWSYTLSDGSTYKAIPTLLSTPSYIINENIENKIADNTSNDSNSSNCNNDNLYYSDALIGALVTFTLGLIIVKRKTIKR